MFFAEAFSMYETVVMEIVLGNEVLALFTGLADLSESPGIFVDPEKYVRYISKRKNQNISHV